MFEKIKKIMEIKGITPYQLEKDTGISQSLFSAWKVGKGKPKLENLEKLATYFNVSITYFFTGEIIEKQQTNFSNEDILLARELNKTDKLDLIKDIMRIKEQADVQIIKLMTEKILKTQGK